MNLSTPTSRILCRTLAFILANAIVPFGLPKLVIESWPASKPAPKKKAPPKSHFLTGKDMRKLQGKTGENPYLAGQSKWDVTFKGVDLLTGNYSLSATDLDFEGGYGIPVNVTRSYSANCADEGPFGKGWTLSADVRSTAGGLLKGPSAPVRSVPTNISEQPPKEYDPNAVAATGVQGETGIGSAGQQAASAPVQGVVTTDAGGTAETVQKDVDGILTTPPWDDNTHNAVYQYVNFQGNVYQVTYSDTMTTIDGTNYTYLAEGSYPNGTLPYNASQMSPPATATPANILKVTSATDRQGNVTTYTYGGSTGPNMVSFAKSDGETSEAPLTGVHMPNGHTLTFTWANVGTSMNPIWRIGSVCDNGAARTVQYGYDGNGDLTTVDTPQGVAGPYSRITTYGYSSAAAPSGWTDNDNPVAYNLLSSITTPQGLTTHIYYQMGYVNVMPYNVPVIGVTTYRVDDPNGVRTYFLINTSGSSNLPTGDNPIASNAVVRPGSDFEQIKDYGQYSPNTYSGTGLLINSGSVVTSAVDAGSNSSMTVSMFDGLAPTVLASGAQGLRYTKTYNVPNQTLITDDETTYGEAFDSTQGVPVIFANPHGLPGPAWAWQDVITAKQYNFMGNPLTSTTTETQTVLTGSHDDTPSTTTSRVAEIQYAYWDSTKYYQQKATLDPAGRYTFTDYYPSSAAAGSRGQTYQVYSPAYATFTNTASTDPTHWQYDILPASTSPYSAQFVYDSAGRATDVYKLQSVSGSAPAYVHTSTTYGTNTDGSWGEASQVVEDAGGINRTTKTMGYTPYGKADDVLDAAGHRFVTSYDLDGLVNNVTRTDTGTNQTLVSYAYGNSGVTNGLPTSITDGLSGVTQSIYYDSNADGGIGQANLVTETNGSDSYTTGYTYDDVGNRATATYSTPQMNGGSLVWSYGDYCRVGTPENPKFAFQTLTKLDPTNSNAATSEAMHYLYDSQGRLEDSAFAQTPTATGIQSDTGSWYDASHPALSRARAYYTYDPAGRTLEVDHYWDSYNTANNAWNASQYLVGNACTYEVNTGLNRGLKLQDSYLGYTTPWTQSYGYDANLDYLTSASYTDGQPNPNQTWTYDAAGNRTSDYTGSGWSYDNLNRMVASPSYTYGNDILGNRIGTTPPSLGGAQEAPGTMTWDCLNRLTEDVSIGQGAHTDFEYRADGMRVQKSFHSGLHAFPGTLGQATSEPLATAATPSPVPAASTEAISYYRYDGQMPMETFALHTDGSTVLLDNGLGARGIDYVQIQSTPSGGSATTSVAFPIYDAHGNEVATLSRSGGSYALNNQRSYGAWGEVRQGATTGGPRGRYCGESGHVQDDETGLVYMRARYYDPLSGRFLNEDPTREGQNFYLYADNIPNICSDFSGQSPDWSQVFYWLGEACCGVALAYACLSFNAAAKAAQYLLAPLQVMNGLLKSVFTLLNISAVFLCSAICCFAASLGSKMSDVMGYVVGGLGATLGPILLALNTNLNSASKCYIALGAIFAEVTECCQIEAAIIGVDS